MADELVFVLKFNTKQGQQQVRKFAAETQQSLRKAFAVKKIGPTLSQALGIETAIRDINQVESAVNKLKRTMSGGVLKSAHHPLGRTLQKGLSNPEISSRLNEMRQEFRSQNRLDNETGLIRKNQTTSGLTSGQITSLIRKETELRGLQNREIERAAKAVRQGVELERKALMDDIKARRTASNVRKGRSKKEFLDIASQEHEYERARKKRLAKEYSARRQAGTLPEGQTFQQFLKAPSKERAREERLAREFSEKRRAGTLPEGQTFQEFAGIGGQRGRSRQANRAMDKAGDKMTPQKALGISHTATTLLAVSSVLAPLNSQLGAVAMQAGFAAFSLGPIPAALSLMSSGLAGWIALMKKAINVSKEAGLETRQWNNATARLKVEVQGFLAILGVKAQHAFAELQDDLVDIVKELEKFPWDEFIDASQEAAKVLLAVAKAMASLGQFIPRDPVRTKFRESDIEYTAIDAFKDVIGSMNPFTSVKQKYEDSILKQRIAERGEKDKVEFVHTPKFSFESVEGLGQSIQRSLLKQSEKDPVTRAVEALHRTIRDGTLKVKDVSRSTEQQMDQARPAVLQ